MRAASVVVLPGDGIGPEVTKVAIAAVDAAAARHDLKVEWSEQLMGGCSIDAHGTALTDEVLEICRASDAVLLGAVGGPKWDTTSPDAPRPEQGLLGLRAGMGLFANLRPVKPPEALYDASPLRRERLSGTDLLVVRELTGGLYFGESAREGDSAYDTMRYSRDEIRRVARRGFEAAQARRGKLTSVDKANVLESSRLWREVVIELAVEYPDVKLDHVLVDAMAMYLLSRPADFDVLVTENMFGDILSDEASMLSGSLGMLPSASLGEGRAGLYEPIHGSAPDIAGHGVANPLAAILSAAMMLRYSLDAAPPADLLEAAVARVLDAGARTRDLGGELGTSEMAQRVMDEIAAA